MKKIFTYFLIAVLTLSNLTAYADDNQLEFKPGDEYKDGIKYEDGKDAYTENAGGVFYSDLNDYSAVGILGALNIMGAAEGNLFKPNMYISRGEFLEGLLKLIKVDLSTPVSQNQKIFYDVDETHEKYSAVYHGVNAGIITGYDDNSFRPDNTISYNEAIICTVRTLGYIGVGDYISISSQIGLTRNLSISNNKAITRLDMAKILQRALETPMCRVELVSERPEYSFDGETPLAHYWKLEFAKGILEANNLTSFSAASPNANTVVINGKMYVTNDKSNYGLIGCLVDYYYDEDDNLIYAHKDKKVSEINISADDTPSFEASTRTLTYDNGNRRDNVKLKAGYNLLYNGLKIDTSYTEDIFKIKSGTIRVLSNDGGSSYDYVFIEEYKNYMLKSASKENNDINFVLDSDKGSFTINAEDTYIEIFDADGNYSEVYRETDKGEKVLDISALQKNSVISVFGEYNHFKTIQGIEVPEKDTKYMKIYVSKNVISGSLNKINATKKVVMIDDKEYDIFPNPMFDISVLKTGENQEFYADSNNKIFARKEGKSQWKYYYLVKPYYFENDGSQALIKMKVYTQAGKLETFDMADSFKLNGKKLKNNGDVKEKITESAKMVNPDFKYQQLIKLILNDDNKITDIQTITQSTGIANGFSEDHLQRSDETKDYRISQDSKGVLQDASDGTGQYFAPGAFITVPSTELEDRMYYSAVKITASSSLLKLDVYDVEDLTPSIVVQYKNSSSDEQLETGYDGSKGYPVMLGESYLDLDEDDEVILKFSVAQAGTTKEYYTYNQNLLDGYKEGELMQLYGYGSEVTKIEPVMYNGKHLGPDNLPSVTNLTPSAVLGFFKTGDVYSAEVYKVLSGDNIIMQMGDTVDGLKREKQRTSCIRNKEWQGGGVLLYQREENGKNTVRQGTSADLRTAVNDGTEKASIVIFASHEGSARQLVVYNL